MFAGNLPLSIKESIVCFLTNQEATRTREVPFAFIEDTFQVSTDGADSLSILDQTCLEPTQPSKKAKDEHEE